MKSFSKNVLVGFALLSNLFASCKSKAQDTVHVSFEMDGVFQNIDDSFNIYFKHNNDSLPAIITKNISVLPLLKDSLYDVVFIYKEYILMFDSIPRTMIIPKGEEEWSFGVESKPFNSVFGVVPEKDIQDDKALKKVYYLHFEPEELDGIVITKKIY